MDKSENSEISDSRKAYYATPGCEGLIQQIMHLLRFGEGLPVVQAGLQAGKSAMAAELAHRMEDCHYLSHIGCSVDQDISTLLENIVTSFDLYDGYGGLTAGESLACLRKFVTQLTESKQLAIFILDDAHLMETQSLGAVLSLLQGNNFPGYGLHMVFFSTPGLIDRIDEMAMLDTPVYDFEIPLFSPSELSGFLKKRFANDGKFSANDVQNFWSQSLGSPGVALNLALNSWREDEDGVSETLAGLGKIPKAHLAALALLVGILIWAGFARKSDIPTDSEPSSAIVEKKLEIPIEKEEKYEASEANLPERDAPQQVEVRENPAQQPEDQAVPKMSVEVVEPEPQDPLVLDSPEVENTAEPKAEVVTNTPISTPSTTQSENMPKSVEPPKDFTPDELFLMDQSPQMYTLQIIAASRKDALIQFMDEQENKNDLFLYLGRREGKAWYVVVTGIFTSRQAAQEAISSLPLNQKKTGPWPRSLSDIQQEIAANRNK